MATSSLQPAESVGAYFGTARSTLNPDNVGRRQGFVYGTYPLILTHLLGCPEGCSAEACCTLARSANTRGRLDFDLLREFESPFFSRQLARRRT